MLISKDVTSHLCELAGSASCRKQCEFGVCHEHQAVILILHTVLCLCHCTARSMALSLTCPRVLASQPQPGQAGVGLLWARQ